MEGESRPDSRRSDSVTGSLNPPAGWHQSEWGQKPTLTHAHGVK